MHVPANIDRRVLAMLAACVLAGREFVLLGRVEGTDYRYVSPCNTCARGFVRAGVLKR
jgi:deoxycytidylate deaminase